MKILSSVLALAIMAAAPAQAATIVWVDEGTITSSRYPLLDVAPVGTPWSLELAFDSDAVGTPRGGPPGSECTSYALQSTTFTLGEFTYTGGGGQLVTNYNHIFGCRQPRSGEITLEMGAGISDDPDAWDLGWLNIRATYRDAVHRELSLPDEPTLSGIDYAFSFYDSNSEIAMQDRNFQPRALVDNTTPVPEPGTMILLGVGLACAGRRRIKEAIASRVASSPSD